MTFLWMVIGLCYFAIWTVVMKNSKMNTTTFCFFYNYIQALFFKNIYIFIYLTGQVFLVAQGTFTASWEIFSCSTQTLSLCHIGSGAHELSSCGAPVSFFMEWQVLVPWPGIESISPALQGEFLTTAGPMKSLNVILLFIDNSVQFSCSVMSNSLWPHGLQHTRPPCLSLTPGVYSNSCPYWVDDALCTCIFCNFSHR